jgi:tetratricopeptide (TPR) repeat protein
MLRGAWRRALALGERCLAAAQPTGDPGAQVLAHASLGYVLAYMGRWERALGHLRQSLEQADAVAAPPATVTDLGVLARCHVALMLHGLGYPGQALAEMAKGLDRAIELDRPHSLAAAYDQAAGLHVFRREPRLVESYADQGIALSVEYGFPHWHAINVVVRGWALAEQGRAREGLAEAQRGQTMLVSIGVNFLPYTGALLAEIRGRAGEVDEGLCTVERAVAAARETGMTSFLSMAWRIKGDLLLQGERKPEAVAAAYRRAVAIAQGQRARSLELRATVQLARLWVRQGRHAAAHGALRRILDQFEAGFDTPDLVAARSLLDAPASPDASD